MTTRSEKLEEFEQWVLARGRAPDTAAAYRQQVRLSLACRPITARIVDVDLAPNSRRIIASALKAWAKFTKDGELAALLSEIRLPRAEVVSERTPLTTLRWHELRRNIAADTSLTTAERCAMLLICRRGFRAGAVCQFSLSSCKHARSAGALVFKTKGRILQYSTVAIEDLLEQLGDLAGPQTRTVADLLSPTASTAARLRSARRRIWRLLRAQARGLRMPAAEMYPHRLRHTIATEFYRATHDLVALRDYMGWADIKTASRYVTHLRRDELDAIAKEVVGDD